MNRFYSMFFLVLITFYATVQSGQEINVNFTTNLYPETPIKQVNSLVMKLWSHVDSALNNQEQVQRFMAMHSLFTKEVLLLNSAFDSALLIVQQHAYDSPEYIAHALHDLEYVWNVLMSLNDGYNTLVAQEQNDETIIIKYVLQLIITKAEQVVETGHVMTPLHAFFSTKGYSSEITPLSVPAIMFPVAPIA